MPPHGGILGIWVGVAFLCGLLLKAPADVVTGVATVALAVIAVVQVRREISGGRRRAQARTRRLSAVAWLTRRQCELYLRMAAGGANYFSVAIWFQRGAKQLERHFKEVLALASGAGEELARHGEMSFASFIAATDRYREIDSPSVRSYSMPEYGQLADEAAVFLHTAVAELETMAPRRAHEPLLPDLASVTRRKAVGGSPPVPATSTRAMDKEEHKGDAPGTAGEMGPG